MTIIELNKRFYTVPTSLNELTFRQLVKALDLFEHCGNVYELNVSLLKVITGMGLWRFVFCKAEELQEAIYLNAFLAGKNDLTTNLLPAYKGFVGPASSFDNLRMSEFVFSEDAFFKWKGTGNTESLDHLVAVLYRHKKKGYDEEKNEDGDARVAFNENICSYHAKHAIAGWQVKVKRAIAFWYEGCREEMFAQFPSVFGGSGGDPAKYGLLSIMRNVADKGVHGNFKEVEHLHVRMVMLELDEMMEEKKAENGS